MELADKYKPNKYCKDVLATHKSMTDTAYRRRENDLDNELLTELASDNPSEERIRHLVSQGADINSLDNNGDSVLMNALWYIHEGLPIRFINLLVELGADVNYETEDGSSPLTEAFYTHKAEPVEILLSYGANPNIIIEYNETLLDLMEFDQWCHECEAGQYEDSDDFRAAQEVGKMIVLLKEKGAKNLVDLRTEEVTGWLKIFASYPKSGLMTTSGYIEIDSIKELPDKLKTDFKNWLASHWDSYTNKSYKDKPEDFDRKEHNLWAQRLAKEIKSYLPPEIKVHLLTINAEDEQKFRRNVNQEVID